MAPPPAPQSTAAEEPQLAAAREAPQSTAGPETPPFGSAGATWQIDPNESAATFVAATAWGRIPVTGHLGAVSGTLTWDGETGRGHMAISMRGLSSGVKLRDHHLRGRAFFHVREHPLVIFEATEVLANGGSVRLRGQLVVRGRRHDFECTAVASAVGSQRIALDADVELSLDELGMSRGMFRMIPAGVRAKIHVVLARELP